MEKIKLFFNPKSVAIYGASEREGSVGHTTLLNLINGKDKRTIYIINPTKEKTMDIKCYPGISALPEVPDLVVVATGADTVPEIIEECGKAGVEYRTQEFRSH